MPRDAPRPYVLGAVCKNYGRILRSGVETVIDCGTGYFKNDHFFIHVTLSAHRTYLRIMVSHQGDDVHIGETVVAYHYDKPVIEYVMEKHYPYYGKDKVAYNKDLNMTFIQMEKRGST
jgi:hypothetical protein